MSENAKSPSTGTNSVKTAPPPLLFVVAGLTLIVALAVGLTLYAYKNESKFRDTVQKLNTVWDVRAQTRALPDQEQGQIELLEDQQKLQQISEHYRALHQYLTLAVVGLVFLCLILFLVYQFGLVTPLRRLEQSCRSLSVRDLKGHIWGLDRMDQFGALARAISDIRAGMLQLSDMVVEGADGKQHVRFEGRSAVIFNTLIEDLKDSVARVQQQGLRLESLGIKSEEKIASLGESTQKQNQKLESAIDASRAQLAGIQDEWSERLSTLFHQNNQIQGQARTIVDTFTRDMQVMNEIAVVTGQKVSQTLQTLAVSDRDIKKAADQSLAASKVFTEQTADLSEKMLAATNLLRASGKVMSETTETARTRLTEAVNSVSGHDAALREFLSDTTDKTNRITGLLENVQQSAERAADTVTAFDARMQDFENKSGDAFKRIDDSSAVINHVSVQVDEAHERMNGSLDAMRGHTDMLARILTAIREEYSAFSEEWKGNLSIATPAITQLKETGDAMQKHLEEEWNLHVQLSRQLLGSLEDDVRSMNVRTEKVMLQSEKLVTTLGQQSQRMTDGVNHFDLQISNMSQRFENASTLVLHSNDAVVRKTADQIQDMHHTVQDMVQRLGILSQLTGTLGAVAGQLGQIVPALGEAATRAGNLPLPVPGNTQVDPEFTKRLEEVHTGFATAVDAIRGEFEGARGQIGLWVETLTGGYRSMGDQIKNLDGALQEKISGIEMQIATALQTPPPAPAPVAAPATPQINLGEQLVPAMRLIHEGLEKNLVADETLLTDLQQLHAEVQHMAADVRQTALTLQDIGFSVLSSSTMIPPSTLDQLQQQIEKIATALAQCSAQSGVLATQDNNPVMSRRIVETVMTAITRLNEIAQSIEKMDGGPGPDGERKLG
jgi:methyl-accepting chemotaxis protein